MRLSLNFTLEELTRSEIALRKGLDNAPPPNVVAKLKVTALGLEQIRDLLGCRIFVSSGYRSPEVNSAIGGAPHSQHVKGEAADFIVPAYGEPRAVCQAILTSNVQFDQLIFEGYWVHCSFIDVAPRRSALTAHFLKSGVEYTRGIA